MAILPSSLRPMALPFAANRRRWSSVRRSRLPLNGIRLHCRIVPDSVGVVSPLWKVRSSFRTIRLPKGYREPTDRHFLMTPRQPSTLPGATFRLLRCAKLPDMPNLLSHCDEMVRKSGWTHTPLPWVSFCGRARNGVIRRARVAARSSCGLVIVPPRSSHG